ncbi:hypothetical protein Bbelb_224000 [Branchiostoma belcheri]|nr:hypothetical protein Bbelb_224000 [Branchiostoma belcheri]
MESVTFTAGTDTSACLTADLLTGHGQGSSPLWIRNSSRQADPRVAETAYVSIPGISRVPFPSAASTCDVWNGAVIPGANSLQLIKVHLTRAVLNLYPSHVLTAQRAYPPQSPVIYPHQADPVTSTVRFTGRRRDNPRRSEHHPRRGISRNLPVLLGAGFRQEEADKEVPHGDTKLGDTNLGDTELWETQAWLDFAGAHLQDPSTHSACKKQEDRVETDLKKTWSRAGVRTHDLPSTSFKTRRSDHSARRSRPLGRVGKSCKVPFPTAQRRATGDALGPDGFSPVKAYISDCVTLNVNYRQLLTYQIWSIPSSTNRFVNPLKLDSNRNPTCSHEKSEKRGVQSFPTQDPGGESPKRNTV